MLAPLTTFQAPDYNFGMLPPLAAAAARAVCARATEACPALIRTHLLSVLSSAVAPLYVVSPPNWTPIPIGVNTLCIADVGGSKSPVHECMIQPLKDHARDSFARYEVARTEASAASAEQKFHIKLLKAEIARCLRKQEPAQDLLATLAELHRTATAAPKHRPRLASNLDLESLLHQLDGEYEAVDFLTDEGDKLLSSSLMRHVSDLVDLIDGKPLEFRREKKKHLYASQPRGTFGLLAQPAAIEPFRPRWKRNEYNEHKAVRLGFFSRFLVCVAQPLPMGNQYAPASDDDDAISNLHKALQEFYDLHLINQESGGATPIELALAPDALGYWEELCRITHHLKFGQLSHLADFVSKMLNLTARLAAVLHVWESKTHYVSISCLQSAWALVSWHANQYELVFVPPPPLPQQEADMAAVIQHLHLSRFSLDYKEVPTEPIGLLLSMPSNRLRAALLRMEQRQLIELCGGKTTFINCTKMFSRSRNITWR
ncbi:YfjI family protein [Xanthomonas euvesicatoria]|uniref:YfjI family protein n=1 Tax=Xanthomonas euvesicatoria TaxID=456327 RepID=UPI0030C84076